MEIELKPCFNGMKINIFQQMGIGSRAKRFTVQTKDGSITLGEIKWHYPNHNYTFFPESKTNLTACQLREISEFMAKESLSHQNSKNWMKD